jgi:hypothetical protein
VLVLATAAPAAAVTGGFGVSAALRGNAHLDLTADKVAPGPKTRTCQAGKHKGGVTNSDIFVGEKGKPGVVACEQPPRSSFSPETIAKATAAALAVIG